MGRDSEIGADTEACNVVAEGRAAVCVEGLNNHIIYYVVFFSPSHLSASTHSCVPARIMAYTTVCHLSYLSSSDIEQNLL